MPWTIIISLFFSTATTLASDTGPKNVLMNQFKKDYEKKGGDAYYDSVVYEFDSKHYDTVFRCMSGNIREKDLETFESFLKISASGKISSVTSFPPTKISKCLEPKLKNATFPKPPFSSFTARLRISPR